MVLPCSFCDADTNDFYVLIDNGDVPLYDETHAGSITGENIVIDGGMSKQMVYHNDNGWRYN